MSASGNEPQDQGSYFVYLRIKPADVNRITDDVTGFTFRDDSVVVLSPRKRDELQSDEFKFTKVFRPSCTQNEIFGSVVYPRLEEFFDGEDCLIFSYGTTNSGKSFTMQGTPSCPGIIPRVLRAVFASVGDSLDSDYPLKPHRNKSVTLLNAKSRQEILKTKKSILGCVAETGGEGDANVTISGAPPENMQFGDEVSVSCLPHADSLVGVWVSFYEIYNEVLNDLLNPSDNRVSLNVVRDPEDDSFYPEGLIHIPVDSWEEAFNMYRAGKKNLKVSSTLMNRQSSRSHCVFTIKLLIRPASDPTSFYDLSNLSFCDLAGNERVSHVDGAMVSSAGKKETLKINSSLLALNKCFVMLRSNLGKPLTTMPSFRDSKLTMVFKKFLARRGKLSMLANISQDPEMLASTLHILKMTAVAVSARVEAPQPEAVPLRRRFSLLHGLPTAAPVANLRSVPEDRDLVTPQSNSNPATQDLTELKVKLSAKTAELEELKKELIAAKKYAEELEFEVDVLKDRVHLDAASTQRHESFRRELEEKVRSYHRKELELLSRLHNYQQQCEDLFEQLAEAFDVEPQDPALIVRHVILKHENAVRMATEEIQEINEMNEDLSRQVEISQLKLASANGKLVQCETELELEREMNSSLRAQLEELRKRLESLSTDGSGPNVDQESVSGYEATFEEGLYSQQPVRAHRSLRWLSDEESSPRVPPRGAATTARKKRGRKKKKEFPQPEPELVPQRAARRRLLPRTAGNDHLDAAPSGMDFSVQELQPSPNTFMRSTRNHK